MTKKRRCPCGPNNNNNNNNNFLQSILACSFRSSKRDLTTLLMVAFLCPYRDFLPRPQHHYGGNCINLDGGCIFSNWRCLRGKGSISDDAQSGSGFMTDHRKRVGTMVQSCGMILGEYFIAGIRRLMHVALAFLLLYWRFHFLFNVGISKIFLVSKLFVITGARTTACETEFEQKETIDSIFHY